MNKNVDDRPWISFPRSKTSKSHSTRAIPIKTIAVEVTRRDDKQYEWRDFKIQIKNDTQNSSCPLYRKYDPGNFLIVHFSLSAPYDAVLKFLKNGVPVSYKYSPVKDIFVFFGHSASQLRERTCVLYNEGQGKVVEILQHFGDFERIQDVAKRAARIGLLFSTAESACHLLDEEISSVDDVDRNNFTFTDGCGFISTKCAQTVTKNLHLDHVYKGIKEPDNPSVFQVRVKGCKGVLCHNPCLPQGIQIRPSMEKFLWSPNGPHPLGIVDRGYSRPYEIGSLNKQYIMLLSALGVPDEVFLRKQETYFKELQTILGCPEVAVRFLCANGEFQMAEKLLKTGELDDRTRARLEHLRNRVREPYPASKPNPLHKPKKSAVQKLKIPIEKSRNVYGVCDPTGGLKSGTVFFQPTIRGLPTVLVDTSVVVAKNPCYHPGDIRILRCADEVDCRHLVDCIVFPTDGDRPHSDEIAGSDLDGDKYFVCWDEDLVPRKGQEPCQYPAAKVVKKGSITREDFFRYFARYSNSDVSRLDGLFDRWADAKGVTSSECKLVAALFSRAIDAAKTGEKVRIPPNILRAPEKDENKDDFVWQKLFHRAKLFESDEARKNEIMGEVEHLAEDDLLAILCDQESRLDEYRLFRFLYKWCEHHDALKEIYRFIPCIDFSKFSEEHCRLVCLDLPDVNTANLASALHASTILSHDDIEVFKLERGKGRRWRLLYRAAATEMSWSALCNVLKSPLEKLMVFKFLLGGIQWVIALTLSLALQQFEVMTLNESDEDHLAQAYASVHVLSGARHVLELKRGYSFALENKRLDIYTGKKQNTFICLQEGEKECAPIMSVALDRFRASLARDYSTRIRREQFQEIEVYCVYNHSDPGQKIRNLHSVRDSVEADVTEVSASRQEEFISQKRDFPGLGCDPEELFSDLEKSYRRLNELLQKEQLQSSHLVEMYDKMASLVDEKEQHELACHLESILWRSPSSVSLASPDHYKQLIVCLVSGLREFHLDVVLGEKVRLTLAERVRRCLESMWKREVRLTSHDVCDIIDALLLGNDYNTGCRIVRIIREGHLPLDDLSFHPNALPYFLHWMSLITLESLEEVKQAILTSHSVSSRDRITAQATSADEQESTYTLLVSTGSSPFRPGDGVALSRAGVARREYIAEVTKVSGSMLTVVITWPTKVDDRSKLNLIDGKRDWRLYKFPSFVGHRRIAAALKKLQAMWTCSVTLFEGIVGSFRLSTSCSLGTSERDETDSRLQQSESEEASGVGTSTEASRETTTMRPPDGPSAHPDASFSRWPSGNESQNAAVRDATGGSAVSLIQGPPGSGKTITCAEIVRRWLLTSQDPVLLVAETNEGVDNLLKKLLHHGIQKENVVRYGSSGRQVAKDLESLTFEFKYREQVSVRRNFDRIDAKIAKRILGGAKVVCTTCVGAGSALLDGLEFKRVLIDEASQATEPAILVSLSHGCQKLVLVGDDQQLPPMVQSELAKGADELTVPLFSRLRGVGFYVRMLDTQYRMHPMIAHFPSHAFYDGRLKNGVSTEERIAPKGFNWPDSSKPVAFLKMPDSAQESSKKSSKLNYSEAKQVSEVLRGLLEASDVSSDGIGVVTPYRAQLTLISEQIRDLENVSVRTVDGFQGQERDVIFFSAVRCNEQGYVGFLDDEKRLNVLLTRARRGLIVIGNETTLAKCDVWSRWIQWIGDNNLARDCCLESSTDSLNAGCSSSGRKESRGSSGGKGRGRQTPHQGEDGGLSRGRGRRTRGRAGSSHQGAKNS